MSEQESNEKKGHGAVDTDAIIQQALENVATVGGKSNSAEDGTPKLNDNDSNEEEQFKSLKEFSNADLQKRMKQLASFTDGGSALLRSVYRREYIERTLKPLSWERFLSDSYVVQEVTPRKGLTYTFRSVLEYEEDFVLNTIAKKQLSDTPYSDREVGVLHTAISLIAVTGVTLAEHRKPREAAVDSEAFANKVKAIKRLPAPVLDDIFINANWFNDRVASLLSSGLVDLPNG